MPIHIMPGAGQAELSRRRFLAHIGALGAMSLTGTRLLGGGGESPAAWALLADTHIDASDAEEHQGSNMAENLRRVVEQVVAARVDAVVIDGDIARLVGNSGDYVRFLAHTEPLRSRSMPLHLTLGNHDDRDKFLGSMERAARTSALSSKYASGVVQNEVHWLLLDSLDKVNGTPGILGKEQLSWLGQRLDAEPARPAVLFVHHNPEATGAGLQDTASFLEVIRPRRQVKAVFFGHTHRFRLWQDDGIHMVNLPAVAYAFDKKEPLGWVLATAQDEGLEIELKSLDTSHPKHGHKQRLAWRAPVRRLERV